ncbi:four-carbon acid sugar kinase family protein [Lentzea sp. NPDC060358]|uniref:four-carbon acid sugar kinase family protein n=1 Tax=Lentzea sp. NPDC060358 TaxID=3347103 RepID=UPI00365C5CEB
MKEFPVFAVADDLSGAAETAVALSVRGTRSVVLLNARDSVADVVVLDTDSRGLPPAAAHETVLTALAGVRAGDRVFKKIDSVLRGNVAAEVAALTARGYGVALTPALPVAGRTVVGGALRVAEDGWRANCATSREVLPEALTLGLDVVRGPALGDALAKAADTCGVVVCDAETDADLDALACAAVHAPATLALAGSGALAAALGRTRTPSGHETTAPPPSEKVLVVVGSAEPVAAAQVARLTGCTVHSLDVAALLAGPVWIPRLRGVTVLCVAAADGIDPAVSAALARTVAAVPDWTDLVLVGGETARRVLDALGVGELEPFDQIHHGAVRSRTRDGRVVVTRPGSFGGPDSLAQIVRALTERPSP